jgi:hypothetical protein
MASIVAVARRRSLRSFLAGSLLGGAVVVVARRRRGPETEGLAAFEGAPCYRAGPDGSLPPDDPARRQDGDGRAESRS